jgi:hypothetical protein
VVNSHLLHGLDRQVARAFAKPIKTLSEAKQGGGLLKLQDDDLGVRA